MSNDAGEETAALVPAEGKKTAVDVLRDGFERLQRRDLKVVEGMNRFVDLPTKLEDPEGKELARLAALDDVALKAEGWTRRDLRLAMYARLPKSQWPAAMQAAHERVGMRIRKQSAQAKKTTFNVNVVNIPAAQPVESGKIITVEAEEKPPF